MREIDKEERVVDKEIVRICRRCPVSPLNELMEARVKVALVQRLGIVARVRVTDSKHFVVTGLCLGDREVRVIA